MATKKDYLTIEETAQAIGVKRSTVYHYLKHLNIKSHPFPLTHKKYIAAADVERIKQAKAEPWKVEIAEGAKREITERDEAYTFPCSKCGTTVRNGWHLTDDKGWKPTDDAYRPLKYDKYCTACKEKVEMGDK
jgi:hypothetical protein